MTRSRVQQRVENQNVLFTFGRGVGTIGVILFRNQ